MQLKSITSAKEAGFSGIEFVKTDKAITEVIIGGRLRIRKGESYNSSLQVLVEQPYEEAKRFRMTAKVEGFDPKVSYHDTDYDARAASSDMPPIAEISIEEVTVHINDDGEVVEAEATGKVCADNDADFIPF